jgi:hypothetical protein
VVSCVTLSVKSTRRGVKAGSGLLSEAGAPHGGGAPSLLLALPETARKHQKEEALERLF